MKKGLGVVLYRGVCVLYIYLTVWIFLMHKPFVTTKR